MADEAGTRLFLGEDMGGPEMVSLTAGHVGVFSARSPDKDEGKRNEDSLGLYPLGNGAMVIAVADGMGGQPMGGGAADITIKTLGQSLSGAEPADQLRPAILDGVESANAAVNALGVGAATTLAVAQIQDNTVRSYHIGDSHLLLVGNRGKVRFQTIAHSPVGYAVEAGVLDNKGAMFHEDRHLVSNMIGLPAMHIDIGSRIRLQQRDTLVLGSDGLFDNLHLDEIVEIVRKGPLQKAAATLHTRCVRRMQQENSTVPSKPDDMTFVVFRLR
ncbi:MAG: PP2C family protein-serine/threonine phosphatase [Planctomycetota bacterium]|jgi:serine/threonine protein phosphatase PrpC